MAQKQPSSWFFVLCSLEGLAVAVKLLLIPSEGGDLSTARLLLIAIPLVLSVLWIYPGLRYRNQLTRLARPGFIVGFALLALLFGVFLFLLRYFDPSRFLSAYERLSPLLWYFLAISVQMALYLLYLYSGFHPRELDFRKPVYSFAVKVFVFFLLVFGFVAVTRLGVTFDPGYWGEPGVPIMGWQLGLALIGGLLILCIGLYARTSFLDLLLPIGIYLLALIICLSVPVSVLRSSFYMPIIGSKLQPFPYSDSAYYDQMAQSLLIGHPYQGVISTRPLYILFLTLLHLLVGQNYERLIAVQTVVLAFLPVLLYLLGKKIHSRIAGVVVALFFIFREWTSLLISSETRVTNTKMLLVDLPTLFLLLVACLFVFRWLERRRWLDGFVAGGVFGIVLLLRTQSLVIVPFIFLIAIAVLGWRNRSLYRDVALFMLGMGLSIAPWLIHNYRLTGEVAFDASFQNQLATFMYTYQGNEAIQNMNVAGMGLAQVMIQSALRDPAHVFGFIGNHFLATQINAMLALPLIQPYHGLRAPINLYWMNWDGSLANYNILLLVLYMAVASLGLGAAWYRWRWMGLLPLAFSLGYSVSTAISRFSSWRYDFPADWIFYFYVGVGIAELLSQAAVLFGAKREAVFAADPPQAITVKATPVAQGVVLGLVFVIVGASPWMIEKLSPPRYADQSLQTLQTRLAPLTGAPSVAEIQGFASQPHTFLETGRMLYPRFLKGNSGLASATPSPAYMIREYTRLGFMFLNQDLKKIVLPIDKVQGPVLHAADVLVLGCRHSDYVEARLIAFPAFDLVYQGRPLSEPCIP